MNDQLVSRAERKVHLISLGCARNRVDSEVMLGTMMGKGWKATDVAEEADAIVVNTCGFIASAKEESIDTILNAAELKKAKPDLKLVVTGCLTQRYKTQLAKGLPEVDLFIGTDEFTKIGELLGRDTPTEISDKIHAKRTHYLYNEEMPRVNTLAKHAAYVKVAEGCQHNCSFCIIPAIRGRLRSRPISSVVQEVQHLVKDGVQEINLIAQDLAAYGRDRTDQADLFALLKALAAVEGLKWIRCLYVYPEHISDEFLEFFATEPKIVKYLDIPVQHAADPVLKRMNRNVTRDELRTILAKVRARVPDVAIRTSVMVGFPGETEADFQQLCDFVAEQKFRHLGCFTYSQEEGTVAGRLPDQIDDETKTRRQAAIMEIQQGVSRAHMQAYVGQILPVLVEGPSQETELLWQGRLSTQAPEVDGVVYLNDGAVKAGTIQNVRISEAHDYDLVGEVVADLAPDQTVLH
jgi:ribosomal protein S12 methylthiotransferase